MSGWMVGEWGGDGSELASAQAIGAILVLRTGSGKKPPRQHPTLQHRYRCWI